MQLRLVFFACFVVLIANTGSTADSPSSLRAAASGHFTMGVGISDSIPERRADWPLLTQHFGSVTPENCLKPDPVQTTEDQFNFTRADAFVEFARSKNLEVVGHCLVWAKDDRTPPWFFRNGTDTASRDVLLARMKTHIDTVVGRYRGRIAVWDVVNEALDDGTNFLRPSGWATACGEDFIAKAFEFAHAADPKALLVYNDYNNELPAKREKLIRLVRTLREKKVPVHAIGLQGHYEIDGLPLVDLEATLLAMRELDMKVVVSELDIDVIPRGKWWADGGKHREELARLDPYRDGCPPEILQRQAEQYAQLFALFRKYSDVIARVSFWNLHDGQSWLNYFPWNRVNHPLLFNRDGKPKPAFGAVIAALQGATKAGTTNTFNPNGTWKPIAAVLGGARLPKSALDAITLKSFGDTYEVVVDGEKEPDQGTCKFDLSTTPKRMTITSTNGPNRGKTFFAIYEMKDSNSMRVCYDLSGSDFPKEFKAPKGTEFYLVGYRRQKE